MRTYITFIANLFLIINGINAMRDISSKELVKELYIGWNLGNTLDAKCNEDMGYSDQTSSETCWNNPRATQELFNVLSENQYNTFRIPVTWVGHFGDGPDYIIYSAWLKRVHEVVDYALNTNSYVILNLHYEDSWISAYTKNLATAKAIMKSLWTQIAQEFEDKDEHLIFECMNEPRKIGDVMEWSGGDEESWAFINELNSVCIETIRLAGGNNPLRHIMIPAYAASTNENALQNLKYPANDNKLIVSVHSYTPYGLTLDSSDAAYTNFDKTGEDEINYVMSTIANSALTKNIPFIISQFGSVDRNNYEDRIKWAKYYVESAKNNGIPCVLWDNGVFSGDSDLFGFINRYTYKFKFPYIHYSFLCGLGQENYCAIVDEAMKNHNYTIEDDNLNNENDTTTPTQTQNNNASQTPNDTNNDTDNIEEDNTSSVDYHHVINMMKSIKLVYFFYFIILLIINNY